MATSGLDGLTRVLAANNRYAGWCTFAVFLGLILEYTILLFPKWKELKRWERIFTVLAALAIAGGVGGEYYFGSGAAGAAMQIEGISETRLAELNSTANTALLEQERLKQDNLRLQALIQPRSLTPEQQRGIGDQLRHSRVSRLQIGSFRGDPESYQFCEEIVTAFTIAHFDSSDLCGNGPVNAGDAKRVGVYIESWREDEVAAAMAKALTAIGKVSPVSITNIRFSSDSEPFLAVLIATKPLPKADPGVKSSSANNKK